MNTCVKTFQNIERNLSSEPHHSIRLQTCEIAAENACLIKDDGKTVKGKQVIGRQTTLLQLRNKGAFL